jgi:hypothetical protein
VSRKTSQARKRLSKRAKKGFRGYPIGTLAFYGPDDRRATKLVASIVEREGAEPSVMQKWFSEEEDVRNDIEVVERAAEFLERHGARSVVMPDRIIGCPHEEGIDYEGPTCPQCPFWAIRDRWSGEVIR